MEASMEWSYCWLESTESRRCYTNVIGSRLLLARKGIEMMHRAWMQSIPALTAMTACLATCCAQYRILLGKADSDGCMPTTPARI